jgi:hypothetical protein
MVCQGKAINSLLVIGILVVVGWSGVSYSDATFTFTGVAGTEEARLIGERPLLPDVIGLPSDQVLFRLRNEGTTPSAATTLVFADTCVWGPHVLANQVNNQGNRSIAI